MDDKKKEIILSPLVTDGVPKFMSFAFHRFIERVVWTFAELGIADLMANHKTPLTACELSKLNGNDWDAEFLYRLLRSAADADIVKELESNNDNVQNDFHPEYENRFQLTDNGLFLTSTHPSKARDLICLELGPITHKPSAYLPSQIKYGNKNGNGFQLAHGCAFFDYLSKDENKEYSTSFNNAMTAYSNYAASSICLLIDFSRFKIMVDIGGSFGSLLSIIMEKTKNLNGIVFDLTHVIENAKNRNPNEFQEKQIESDRYKFVEGDMFKYETIPEADCYILKFIIHDWNDEDSIKILKSIRFANGNRPKQCITIFLVDMILLSDSIHNWPAKAMDIEMLSFFDAKERTIDQYIKLLKKSGYEYKQLYQTNSPFSVIEAMTIIDVFN